MIDGVWSRSHCSSSLYDGSLNQGEAVRGEEEAEARRRDTLPPVCSVQRWHTPRGSDRLPKPESGKLSACWPLTYACQWGQNGTKRSV